MMNTAITTTQNQLTEDTILGFIKPLIRAIIRFIKRLFGKSEWPPSPGSNDRPVVKVKVNVPIKTPEVDDSCKNPEGTPDLVLTLDGYFRSVDNWDKLILGLYSGGGEYFPMPATTTVTYSYDNPQAPTKTYANYVFNTDCFPDKLQGAQEDSNVNHNQLWVSYDAANQDTVLVNSEWESTLPVVEPAIVTEVGDRPKVIKVKIILSTPTPTLPPSNDPVGWNAVFTFNGYVADVVDWNHMQFGITGSPLGPLVYFPAGTLHSMHYENESNPRESSESYARYNLPKDTLDHLSDIYNRNNLNKNSMWVFYGNNLGHDLTHSEWIAAE